MSRPRDRGSNGTHGSHWIRPRKRLAIYLRDGFRCAYCGWDMHGSAPSEITLDHLRARLARPDHSARNLVAACRSCNSARGARPWRAFARTRQTWAWWPVERIVKLRRRSMSRFLALADELRKGDGA